MNFFLLISFSNLMLHVNGSHLTDLVVLPCTSLMMLLSSSVNTPVKRGENVIKHLLIFV